MRMEGISALQAAKATCECAGWRLSNLALNRVLYIAHMYHLGQQGRPLIKEVFEAWDYGPILPAVYHKAKIFGRKPVRNIFRAVPALPEDTDEYQSLSDTVQETWDWPSARLIAVTHWKQGAFYRYYTPDLRMPIPHEEVFAEYHRYMNHSHRNQGVTQ